MSNSAFAEIIFVAIMMLLSLVIGIVAMFFFARQFRLEKRAKLEAAAQKAAQKQAAADKTNHTSNGNAAVELHGDQN